LSIDTARLLFVEEGNHGKIVASTSKPATLRLMRVKLLLAIALKPLTLTLKSGLSVLVPVMCVDSADEESRMISGIVNADKVG
jgi:hypothetical protein